MRQKLAPESQHRPDDHRRFDHERLIAECRDLPCLKQLLPCRLGRDFWVFGYGSLMWNPGFPHAEARPALLRGYHRRFCVWSHSYRGTPERPGLVLGLDRGGSCHGMALKVGSEISEQVLDYLHEREMSTRVYHPRLVRLFTAQGPVLGLAFVVDRHHVQYTGRLDLAATASLIAEAAGDRGPCAEYLCNTVQKLEALSIDPGQLRPLLRLVQQRYSEPED